MPLYWLLMIALRSLQRNGKIHLISAVAMVIGMSIFILGTAAIQGLDEQTIRAQEQNVSGDARFLSSHRPQNTSLEGLQSIDNVLEKRLQTPEVIAWTGRAIFVAQMITSTDQLLVKVNGYHPNTDPLVFDRSAWDIKGTEPSAPESSPLAQF